MKVWQYQSIAKPVFVPPAPPMSWMVSWGEPVRPKRPVVEGILAAPTFKQPDPSFAWYADWAKPLYRKTTVQDWIAAPVFVPIVVTPSQLSWLLGWDNPQFKRVTPNEFFVSPFVQTIVVTPVQLAWLQNWDNPNVSRRTVQDFSCPPIFQPPVPPTSWFGEWSTPQFRRVVPHEYFVSPFAQTVIVVASTSTTDPEIHLFKLSFDNKMHKL